MLLRPGLFRAAKLPPSVLHRTLLARRSFSSYSQPAGQAVSERWLYAILGLNTAVFAAWKYADNTIPFDLKASLSTETYRQVAKYVQLDKRQLLNSMYNNFVFKSDDFKRGNWWTSITAAFSHLGFAHFAFNMIALNSFGGALINYCPKIRPVNLVTLYLGAGLAGTIAHYYQNKYYHNNRPAAAVGASGSVMGIATACAVIAPHARWQLMFIPVGIPAWVMISAYFAYDAFYLSDANSRIGHGGHLGGAAFGVAYYFLALRGLRFPGRRL